MRRRSSSLFGPTVYIGSIRRRAFLTPQREVRRRYICRGSARRPVRIPAASWRAGNVNPRFAPWSFGRSRGQRVAVAGSAGVVSANARMLRTQHNVASAGMPACIYTCPRDAAGQLLWPGGQRVRRPAVGRKRMCFSCHGHGDAGP